MLFRSLRTSLLADSQDAFIIRGDEGLESPLTDSVHDMEHQLPSLYLRHGLGRQARAAPPRWNDHQRSPIGEPRGKNGPPMKASRL